MLVLNENWLYWHAPRPALAIKLKVKQGAFSQGYDVHRNMT